MHFSNEEKTKWLEDWRQSGMKAFAFAKVNGIIPQTFANWVKHNSNSQPCLVEVPMKVVPPLSFSQEILIEKNDMKIHLPLSIDYNELHTVLKVLRDTL